MTDKIERQLAKAELPRAGNFPFEPEIKRNARGIEVIVKAEVLHGPKRGKRGYLDIQGRIWIRDHAHAGNAEHWDVQIDGGLSYIKVDLEGNQI